MGLPKGKTNNPKGKPPGALNKISRGMKITITEFLQERWPDVISEFDKLKGQDKVKFYLELLPYAVPKMQAVQVDMELEEAVEFAQNSPEPSVEEFLAAIE